MNEAPGLGSSLTMSLGSVSAQQLAGSLGPEVAAGDVLAVTAVQHFFIPIFFHLLKRKKTPSCQVIILQV